MGHYGEARPYLVESLDIAREVGDKRAVAAVLQPLGVASLGQGDLSGARGSFEEALTLAREIGSKRDVAAALTALAQVHRVEGALSLAEPLYEKVIELARELGDRQSIAIGLLNLAMVAIGKRSVELVRAELLEVLEIVVELGSKPAGVSALEVCAGLAAHGSEPEAAARFFGAAESQLSQTGLHRDPADEAFLAPLMDAARAHLGPKAFAAAQTAGRALSYDQAMLEARAWLDRRS
jgi:tetratricopeptide (TPR) repeat protein